jgi:hypothetical protein
MLRLPGSALLLCFATLLFANQSSSAQTSLYADVAATNFCLDSNSHVDCKSDTLGFLAGGFYNFAAPSRLTTGIDGRMSYGLGSRGGVSATAAVRFGFVPHRNPLRPYFQIGGGIVSSAGGDPRQAQRKTSGALQLAVGLDIRLTSSVDLRAIEIGGAAGVSSTANSAADTSYISTGVVYHFPR